LRRNPQPRLTRRRFRSAEATWTGRYTFRPGRDAIIAGYPHGIAALCSSFVLAQGLRFGAGVHFAAGRN
jgi:hypothetical protein